MGVRVCQDAAKHVPACPLFRKTARAHDTTALLHIPSMQQALCQARKLNKIQVVCQCWTIDQTKKMCEICEM